MAVGSSAGAAASGRTAGGRASPETPDGDQALLAEALVRLEPRLPSLVDDFYRHLLRDPPLVEVLERLTAPGFAQLKRRHAEHVRMMIDPGTDPRLMQRRSREVGRWHAKVGVAMDSYVEAVAYHRRGLLTAFSACAADLDLPRLQSLVTERFMAELHGALLGYRDVDEAQHTVMLRVIEAVGDARTVSDLAGGVVDALGSLDGMAVCLFARTDGDGRLRHEFGAGPGFAEFVSQAAAHEYAPVTVAAGEPTGEGPMGRAWRTGRVQTCDSLWTDPTATPWRALADELELQSSASIPLVDRGGTTRAVLSMLAYHPGFFASAARTALLDQTKRVTERALTDLEERPAVGAAVSSFVDRASHLADLAAGRVEMLFQPLVSLRDGRLTKLEALARLTGPDGLVSPADFLPAFGDDQLFDLFDLGMHQSLDALRRWEGAGLHTGVSVNLPVVSAEDDRYSRLVRELLRSYDVAPGRLTLELLETGFVDRSLQQRRRSLDDFKAIGVRLAQDDLGSGYSSLLRLRHFAFDDVKLDQSLLRGTDKSPGAALGFIEPINAIAHSLGLSVVLEGLEDDGLIEVGVQLAVDQGQGYGIARPMPVTDVAEWVRGYRFDVDPAAPRTPNGGLAGHVAWEHRVTALGPHPDPEVVSHLGACTLTSYLDRLGEPGTTAAHRELHDLAITARDGPEHRAAWVHLSALVCG
jgi:EAL domain-containing protein (putative c-di-GMP-specific phosphodiesterase class I)